MADEPNVVNPFQAARAGVASVLASPVPRFYANTFVNAGSEMDVLTVFQGNGQNLFTLNMSYVTAKSYAVALGKVVENYETTHKVTVPIVEIMTQTSPPDQK